MKPIVAIRNRREGKVDHLVHEHPVATELRLGRVLADCNAQGRAAVGPGLARADPLPGPGDDQQTGARRREASVIGRNGLRRRSDPAQHLFPGQIERPGGERDDQLPARNLDARRRQPVELAVGHARAHKAAVVFRRFNCCNAPEQCGAEKKCKKRSQGIDQRVRVRESGQASGSRSGTYQTAPGLPGFRSTLIRRKVHESQ